MDELTIGVESSAPSSTEQSVVESPTTVEPTGEPQGSVTATVESATSTQVDPQAEIDPLKDVPTVEELQQLAAQKIPHAQALAQLRPAYENLKTQVESYKTLDPWKPLAETIGNPELAQTSYNLVQSIYTPSQENPTGFSTLPFLEQIEQQSPGTPDQLFADLLTFQVEDEQGNRDTLVRHLYRSHGLNPDRIDDYRNIDNLRVSGVVSEADLGKIPEKYHEAFKSLSADSREDLLEIIAAKPLVAEEALRNADRALKTERFEQEQRERETKAQEVQQAHFEQQVNADVEQDAITESQSIFNSVHQTLSQITLASDPVQNDIEHLKILGVIGNLQSPYPVYREAALKTLKAAGVEPKEFEDTVNQWLTERETFVRHKATGQAWLAQQAKTRANFARQKILLKAGEYVDKLAQLGAQKAVAATTQVTDGLAAATSRYVPNGNGLTQQQGNGNPFALPAGIAPFSREADEYVAQVRRQLAST